MVNVTASLSSDTLDLLDGAVEAGAYTGRSDGVREALRAYFEARPELAQEIAVELHQEGEIDFITATHLANISADEFNKKLEAADKNDA